MTGPMGPMAYPGWGVTPQPLPEQPRRSSLRGAVVVVAVMFGWLLVVFGLGAAVARNEPNNEAPVAVNLGVVVTPASGWYSAKDEWNVGQNGIALQRSGVYVAFWAEEFQGTNDELMVAVLDQLRPGFENFRALPSQPVDVAGDLPGLMVRFSGIANWGQEENELVVLSYKGISVVMLAEAQTGQLGWAQDGLDTMLSTLKVPR